MGIKKQDPLVITPLLGLPLIQPEDDLAVIFLEALKEHQISLRNGDIIVTAQKIVSKSEGRLVNLNTVTPSRYAKRLAEETSKDSREVELILQESKSILRKRKGLIIVEHERGFICANAGIDRSNVQGDEDQAGEYVLLLPKNPDQSAEKIRKNLQKASGKEIGVLIIDSHGRAWREGTVGISIGYAGIPGIIDFRGQPDLFDYQLTITQIAAVDELAAGASLMMGQAAEGIPVVHVRGFPYPLRDGSFRELPRDISEDLFR